MIDKQEVSIIERMKSRRNELGMSYQALAERTGLSKSTLQRFESGKIKNIPLAQLQTLATGLRTTPEWLLGLYDDPDVNSHYMFTSQLTPFDMRLLNNFHKADDEMKKAVCKLLDVEPTWSKFDSPEPYVRVDWDAFE